MACSREWWSAEQNLAGGQSVVVYSRDLHWVYFYLTWWCRVYPQQICRQHQTRRRSWYARSSWHPEGPQQAGEVAGRNLLKFNTVKCTVLSPGILVLGVVLSFYAVGHPAGKLPHKICTSTNIANIYGLFQCVKSCLDVFHFQML